MSIGDLRLAVRVFSRRPAFASALMLALALGVAAAAIVASVIHSVITSADPFSSMDRLVWIGAANSSDGSAQVSLPDVRTWAAGATTLAGVAGIVRMTLSYRRGDDMDQVAADAVDPSFFRVLETRPWIGRALRPADDQPDAERVIVISYSSWLDDFHGDSSVLGRIISLDAQNYAVIGVMPRGFDYPPHRGTFGWVAIAPHFAPMLDSDAPIATAIGRLREGASLDNARTEIATIGFSTRAERASRGRHPAVRSLHGALLDSIQPRLAAMAVAAALTFLLALANAGNLFLVRALECDREIAVRRALGASRLGGVLSLLVEGAGLTLIAAFLGTAIAAATLHALPRWNALELPELRAIHLAPGPMIGIIAATLLPCIVVALVISSGRSSGATNSVLRSAMTSSATRQSVIARDLLLALELAITVVLIDGSGLLSQTVARLTNAQSGFDPAGVMTASVTRPYPVVTPREGTEIRQFVARTLRLVRGSPGITDAAFASDMPSKGAAFTVRVGPARDHAVQWAAGVHAVSPGYFSTVRIPLVAGRSFALSDDATQPLEAVIDDQLARRLFAATPAVGHRLYIQEFGSDATIVGVVGNTREIATGWNAPLAVYVPLTQVPVARLTVLVRSSRAPLAAAAIERSVAASDPNQPVANLRPLSDVLADAAVRPRFYMLLLIVFAVISVTLAATGLYGVTRVLVAQRRRELAIRSAVGATPSALIRLVLARVLRPLAWGLLVGLFGSLVFGRILTSMLVGIGAADPRILCVSVAAMIPLVLAATAQPVARAARADPVLALRSDA